MTTNAPDNCKCGPGTWVNGPTEICGDPEYDGSEVCFNCDHNKACHTTTIAVQMLYALPAPPKVEQGE